MKLFFLFRWLGPLLISLCLLQPALSQDRLPQGRLHSPLGRLTPGQAKLLKPIEQAQASGQQLRKAADGTTFIGIKPWRAQSGNVNYWSSDSHIYEQIRYLNRDFRKANIQFYVISSGIGTITATASETLAYPNDEAGLLSQNFDATAINVYFAYGIYDCRGSGCALLPGLTPGLFDIVNLGDRSTYKTNPNVQAKKDDYIMVGFHSNYQFSDFMAPPLSALSHEMGHYFGLLDTQQGSNAATCTDRERPIGNRTAGDTDRGDLIDDTDADPLTSSSNYPSLPYNQSGIDCSYSGTDQHCDETLPVRTFKPPTTNVMSYWGNIGNGLGRCNDFQQFTPHQNDRMQLYLPTRLSAGNQYQLQNGTPGLTVSPTISLSTSQNGSDISITLLPGAVDYILERATDADFTDVTIPAFAFPFYSNGNVPVSFRDPVPRPAGKTFYYRVRAINSIVYSNVVSCTPPTATLTGSQTVTNGQSATYTVALTGTPPWNVQVGGQTYPNVTTSPLKVVTAPFQALQTTYTQSTSGGSVTNVCSTAPMSGTASVTVQGTCPDVSTKILYGDIGCSQSAVTGTVLIAGVDYVQGAPTPYTIQWKNVTTGVSYSVTAFPTVASNDYVVYGFLGYTYFGEVRNLPAGQYTVGVTDRNGCPATPQTFTIRDFGPNGSTAKLTSIANSRIVKGQQTSIRVELTGTAPWSVTYAGRGGRQSVESNITTASYDIAVLPDSTTTYRLVAVSGQCSSSAVSGSVTLIVVPALTALEYFFDTEPGVGHATSIAVGFNQTTFDQTLALPVSNLLPGLHLLVIRARDGNGYWSTATMKPFVAFGTAPAGAKAITQVEYILDGVDSRTAVSVAADNNQPITLPVSLNLLPGSHTISTRVKDNMGRWSSFTTRTFLVIPTSSGISRIEYYFDTANPSLGSGTALSFSPANGTAVTGQEPVSVAGLATGPHTVNFRAQAGTPVWSTTKTASFTVTACATALATLYGSSTITTDQVASLSVLIGGTTPYSLTANGQSFASITTSAASFTAAFTVPGTYTVTPQSMGLAVANPCGTGQVGGSATVTVLQGTACTVMQTVKAGSWNDPTMWSCGRLPVVSDAVLIRHVVTVPAGFVSHAKKVSFNVGGKLSWGAASRLLIGL